MSAANHTLNSLRYAERLKEGTKAGQGGQGGSKGPKAIQEEHTEELRAFMEKHGKSLDARDNLEEDKLNKLFY